MPAERFSVKSVIRLLQRQQVATMDELKDALGTRVDMTVFRKLRTLTYLSSYSHGGRYYTLQEVADFDQRGLWTCRGVHFSRFGSLVDTAEVFVNRADCGYLAAELTAELAVQAKDPLLMLVRAERLSRAEVSGCYVYCAVERTRRRQQLITRQLPSRPTNAFALERIPTTESDETKAAFAFFVSLLDERQRRLFGGLESLRIGRGGDREVAEAIGLDPHTISRGRRDLVHHDLEVDRVRRPGAGRPLIEKKSPRSSRKLKGS
ncbi:MAG: hypothetical protein Q7J06_11485 [Bacteroidales bacterium]|nr:hypothetical protein [Bacteroidales bacterium]